MNWTFPGYEIGQPLNWEELERRYDWIADMRGVPQDPVHHAEGDVLTHTRMVVEALTESTGFAKLDANGKHILVAAVLLHDVEKRSTTSEEIIDGRATIVSPRHAKHGENTARAILYRDIPTPFRVREQICKLVRHHGLPLWAMTKEDPDLAVIKAATVVNTNWLALLAEADVRGRICEDTEELYLRIDLFGELCRENGCYGHPRVFDTTHARYRYLTTHDADPNYVPYDDFPCTVTVLSALPGTGKDTYLRRNSANLPILSLDDLRRAARIAPTDKKGNGRVVQAGKDQARVHLRAGQDFVFNATNLTVLLRRRWIELFTSYGARVHLIYLEVPYRKLLKQNADRPHPVPRAVLERMIDMLEVPSPAEAHVVTYHLPHETA